VVTTKRGFSLSVMYSALPTTRRSHDHESRLLAGARVLCLRGRHLGGDLGAQATVLGQAENVVDAALLAPAHDLVVAEAGVAADDDPRVGPAREDLRGDPLELLDRMLAGRHVGGVEGGSE
jgi:hypothetical protein